MTPVFDGHNDILYRILQAPEKREEIWLTGEGKGHLDLPRMQAGGFAGGFFAIYVPSPVSHDFAEVMTQMDNPPYALPLPDLIDFEGGLPVAFAAAGHLLWMERAAKGAFRLCRTAGEIRAAMAEGVIAGLMHMEGAEAIDEDLDALHSFHAMGLRSLGPVWSRPTIFGHGVPFCFPSSPDTGPGLTEAGKRLVKECNALKVLVDLSHLNEKGFDDVARLSDAPLVATHSNAHAICPSSRNLTDRQLEMIRESRGMVGVNYAVNFLNEDGLKAADRGWVPTLRHLDYLLERLGEDHVGLGSDFDGADVAEVLGDVAGLQGLIGAMREHGYGEELITKIAHENWLGVLERTFGA
ncbi:dipeptidase AC [Rhodobacter aestuarii]|uniref:Dipeptidase AC. Metallo peptidase. MEROPS family M19 n=1 Tax=Rhodobacter aestuarii TaxID=453582 RepID=A0A1N7P4N9_9RHOB|nr:dipeptidase [Rhodobacter aestuarii]PTV97582.1 dipeptidase AC [Rhodobacter aestuarii]SIT05605.1 dipeptidase AC. Metallo peptidase. MEROPS family M19 [Rhodobacter aestuarii]